MNRIQRLQNHMEAHSLTQTAVAKSLGISISSLSYWLKAKYKGDVAALDARVDEYLATVTEREARPAPPASIVATRAYQEIHAFLKICARDCEMGLVVGDSGVGKTTALREYAREHRTSILVEADHGYTARALFLELCDSLGLDSKGTLHDLLVRVVAKLRDSGRLIIVDEAEHLPYRALELIRRIHDKAGVGVALVGMPRLRKNLQGDANHYAQLYSRVGAFRKVEKLTDEDVTLLVSSRRSDVTPSCLEALLRASRRNARVLHKLLRWCDELCKINKISLNLDVIMKAEEMISVAA